jgi:hypothetical protein
LIFELTLSLVVLGFGISTEGGGVGNKSDYNDLLKLLMSTICHGFWMAYLSIKSDRFDEKLIPGTV